MLPYGIRCGSQLSPMPSCGRALDIGQFHASLFSHKIKKYIKLNFFKIKVTNDCKIMVYLFTATVGYI